MFQKYISPGLQVGSLGIQEAAKNIQYIEGGDSKRRIPKVDEPVVGETCRSMMGLLLSGFSNQDMRAGRLAGGMPVPARGLGWISVVLSQGVAASAHITLDADPFDGASGSGFLVLDDYFFLS